MSTFTQIAAISSISIIVVMTSSATGQAMDEPVPLDEKGKWDVFVSGGYNHQFETSIDRADDFDVERFGAGLGLGTRLSEDVSMMLRFSYTLDMYDFGGGSNPFGGHPGRNPWDDINTINAGVVFGWDVDDDINLFGGGIGQSARESGAGWDHSWAGGGIVGGSYLFSPELRLGGGLEFFDELGDDWKYIFLPVVEWTINDEWRVSTSASSMSSRLGVALTGIELIYKPTEHWQFALGFAQNYSRFRLDDTGPASRGIGQDESYPLWIRAVWNINDTFQFDAIGGVMLAGDLDLINAAGATVATSSYDASPFIGVFASIRF